MGLRQKSHYVDGDKETGLGGESDETPQSRKNGSFLADWKCIYALMAPQGRIRAACGRYTGLEDQY